MVVLLPQCQNSEKLAKLLRLYASKEMLAFRHRLSTAITFIEVVFSKVHIETMRQRPVNGDIGFDFAI